MSKTPMESKDDQHQFWQMAIETWRSSGLTIRQFCKQEGLSEPSFYSWRKRLAPVKPSEADIQPPRIEECVRKGAGVHWHQRTSKIGA